MVCIAAITTVITAVSGSLLNGLRRGKRTFKMAHIVALLMTAHKHIISGLLGSCVVGITANAQNTLFLIGWQVNMV